MSARIHTASLLLAALTGALLSAGCSDPAQPMGSGGTTGSGGTPPSSGGEPNASGGAATDPTVPADISQAGLEAFLAAGSYTHAPWWVFDDAVRDSAGTHQNVRVYYNPTAQASIDAGNNDFDDEEGNSIRSMAVKELYDDAGTLTGTAIMLRTALDGSDDDWLYYCSSSSTACTGSQEAGPIYEAGADECKFCHGGLFISAIPE